jgi:hypothetical protein
MITMMMMMMTMTLTMTLRMEKMGQVRSRRVIIRRPLAVQAEKKNFGEAQALYPRGVVNRMMKTAYLTSEVRRLRAPQRRHA